MKVNLSASVCFVRWYTGLISLFFQICRGRSRKYYFRYSRKIIGASFQELSKITSIADLPIPAKLENFLKSSKQSNEKETDNEQKPKFRWYIIIVMRGETNQFWVWREIGLIWNCLSNVWNMPFDKWAFLNKIQYGLDFSILLYCTYSLIQKYKLPFKICRKWGVKPIRYFMA